MGCYGSLFLWLRGRDEVEYLEVGTAVKRPTDREILDFFYLGLIAAFTLFMMTTWWFGSPFLVHGKS